MLHEWWDKIGHSQQFPLVRTVYRERTATHHATSRAHTNPLMETLLKPPSNRRLKRKWTFDETNQGRVKGLPLVQRHQLLSH